MEVGRIAPLLLSYLCAVIRLCSLNEMASTSESKKTEGRLPPFLEILWKMVNDESEQNKIKESGEYYISWNKVFLLPHLSLLFQNIALFILTCTSFVQFCMLY